ncbi:efflux pump antibiotic resistance protein [Penicillium malachiteum]|uniref:efflux pump antibiotic resistance protein n=1 Tax=Penicillium malachiteum TaxID=1324776 RepID=UPI002548A4FE|nr:efflux pump antibiotic resistance protein [Penicillium malachiteum]KAJ5720670.1 efflux pump antibiotic resistance protein [Penicillium malachiteum]
MSSEKEEHRLSIGAHARDEELAASTVPEKFAEEDVPAENVTYQDNPSKQRIVIILLGLGLSVFLAALDITIVSTALPEIVAHFHASDSAYSWIASSYLLANAACVGLWGRLTGRALQGVGSGGITVMANICVSDLFDVQRRAAYLGIFGATWAIAGAVGPIIGGAFTTYVTWRWCFYINLPVGGIAFLFLMFFLKIDTTKKNLLDGLAAIDWIGVGLVIAGTILLLLGLEFGGDQFAWSSATVICLIVFGIIALILFGIYERFPASPIIPLAVFSSRQNVALLLINFCHGVVFIGGCFYLPVYFQNVLLKSSIMSGVLLLPLVGALAVSSGLGGWYMRATGRFREVIIFGMFFTTLAYGLYLNLQPYASWSRIVLFQMVAGLGLGPNFQATLIALQANVSPTEMSQATAAFSLVRQIAASISVVVATVIYNYEVAARKAKLVAALGSTLAAEIVAASTSTASLTRGLPDDEQDVIFEVITKGLWYVWLFFLCVSAFGLVLACTLRNLHKAQS